MGKFSHFAGLLAAVLMSLAGTASAQSAPAPIEGTWMTLLESEITIIPCPEGWCGFISKVVVPEKMLSGADGDAIRAMSPDQFFDAKNKDPLLRDRPIMGLQILTLRPGKSPQVFDGEVYNPEDGNTYSGYIEVTGPDMLRLNGCVLFNLLCKGEDWFRVVKQ